MRSFFVSPWIRGEGKGYAKNSLRILFFLCVSIATPAFPQDIATKTAIRTLIRQWPTEEGQRLSKAMVKTFGKEPIKNENIRVGNYIDVVKTFLAILTERI